MFILVALLILSVFLEGTLTSLPLVLLSLILLTVLKRDRRVFGIAFLSGIFLDLLLVRSLGQTSVFFLIMVLFIFLYERKYEITSLLFVSMGTLISATLYFFVFPTPEGFVQIISVTLLAVVLFSLLTKTRIYSVARG